MILAKPNVTTTEVAFPKLNLFLDKLPQSIEIGPLNIHLYGIIIAIGLLLAVVYAMKRRTQFGLTEDDLLDGVLIIGPVSVIFARAYYCIFEWEAQYKQDWTDIFRIWEGGLAIYGAVIGAALSIIAYCYFKRLKIAAVLDITSLGFLIGQSVGRWGNFFNTEAFGGYCDGPLAMRVLQSTLVQDGSAELALLKQKAIEGGYEGFYQVHPTFLYESLWNLTGFVLLHFLSKKRRYDGQIALGYVAWYGLGRALIEGLRMDSLYIGPFRVSQLLAALSCLAALGVLIFMSTRKHDPAELFVNQRAVREREEQEAEAETEAGEDA